jgi:TRAP-type C4-dicarboxylate transport system substrate-binding protein
LEIKNMAVKRPVSRLLGGVALGVSMSLAAASNAVAQDVTLKLHQFLPAQANVPAKILDVWADKVEAASDGSLKIDRFPSMQLGGAPPGLMDQAIDGVAILSGP